MWFLKKLNGEEGELYPLFTRSEHIIGRSGNLDLAGDASVSRRHACIKVTLKNGKVKLSLTDLGSKYGTYLNDGITLMNAVSKSEPVELKIGDQIRFGMQANTWIIEESRFCICTSMLSSQDKNSLNNIVKKLNADMVSNWSVNCTHLIMTQIKTSVKAICALARVRPIVTLDYWKHLAAAFANPVETALPNCDDFVPEIAEPQLKSLHIDMRMNRSRRMLFKNYKFIVLNRLKLNDVSLMVEAAGGSVDDGSQSEISEDVLCQEKVVVVHNNSCEANNRNVLRVLNILNSRGLRSVKETEICLSIAECSTERYCNPSYDASVLLRLPESQITVKDEPAVLAVDTQDTQPDTQFLETASGNFSLNVNERIVFSESEDEDIVPDSSPSVISASPSTSASTKRKLPDALKSTTKAKNARLDNWLINKRNTPKDTGESPASESLLSSAPKANKTAFKDLFSFRAAKKDSDKASSSLFGAGNDSSQSPAAVPENKPTKSTRSVTLFASTSTRSTETGDQRVSRAATLFSKANASRTTRNSNCSLSAGEQLSTAQNCAASKRKHEDAIDGEIRPVSRSAMLFDRPAKRPNTIYECVISDSDDESELIARKRSKLAAANDLAPPYQDSPVDVPSKMSLSQFLSAPAKENVTLVTSGSNSPTPEVLDKSVVLTVPLIQSNGQTTALRSTDNSVANFKKFRKNRVCYPLSSIINGTKLISFSDCVKNEFNDD